jgi:nucleoside-diphosphate-sugar epimerase
MICGSGLLATAFSKPFKHRDDVCIYAAGVSNSSNTTLSEFARERERLAAALQATREVDVFVYFGTCSVGDPEAQSTPYVQHKLLMEQLVAQQPRHLILRLPQVAGHTPNPHTLLNFLYACIARSEAFSVWRKASRNIIDVEDVATLAGLLIADQTMRGCTFNLANPHSYAMVEIVGEMEKVVGKPAIYDIQERGYHYEIDVAAMLPALAKTNINFDNHYLSSVLSKYYEKF